MKIFKDNQEIPLEGNITLIIEKDNFEGYKRMVNGYNPTTEMDFEIALLDKDNPVSKHPIASLSREQITTLMVNYLDHYLSPQSLAQFPYAHLISRAVQELGPMWDTIVANRWDEVESTYSITDFQGNTLCQLGGRLYFCKNPNPFDIVLYNQISDAKKDLHDNHLGLVRHIWPKQNGKLHGCFDIYGI